MNSHEKRPIDVQPATVLTGEQWCDDTLALTATAFIRLPHTQLQSKTSEKWDFLSFKDFFYLTR